MKKVILSAAILMIGMTVASGQSKEANARANTEFRQYISKQINRNIDFIDEHVQGTFRFKLNVSSSGFDSVYVVNGVNEQIDNQLIKIIKNTPNKISSSLYKGENKVVELPISFIIKEN
ncbi:MAG: hypothetical protein SFY32_15990 [Bacteroidota bacterium]|nr:hypothetical protein [Bacteroidota bacterium]